MKSLRNRTPFSTTVDNKLLQELEDLHQETRIPKSKLTDEAIALLLKKHQKRTDE